MSLDPDLYFSRDVSKEYIRMLKAAEENGCRIAANDVLYDVVNITTLYTKLSNLRSAFITTGKCDTFAKFSQCLHSGENLWKEKKDPSKKQKDLPKQALRDLLNTKGLRRLLKAEAPDVTNEEADQIIDFLKNIEEPCSKKESCEM